MIDRPTLRVLVVDDEPLGRRRIESALAAHSDIEVVGAAGDGAAAVDAIRQLRPALVFLDVQMPRMSGLDVVRTLGEEMPLTIFVTAYDKHAVAAFDLAATDYLVKPFDDDRFDQALARARKHLEAETAARIRQRLLTVLREEVGSPTPAPVQEATDSAKRYADRIPVESRGVVRLVPTSQIDAVVASGAYAELVAGDKRYLIRETMSALEEQLDPSRFFRIHRSTIVALDQVESFLRGAGGDYEVKLHNGARLAVARNRRLALEERLGIKRTDEQAPPGGRRP